MTKGKYYITTTLPYVNSAPHVGFALEIIQADVLARYHRLLDEEVIFNFGTDEHGQKIYRKALEQKKDPQAYCDEYAAKFDNLKEVLNLSYNHFIRTTNPNHARAVGEFWQRCLKKGDIYKKNYKQKYCVGCELEKTDSELVDEQCPVHPNLDLEIIEEENYFFKFSKFQQPLLDFYQKNPDFVVPESKFNEIKAFVKDGLQDFSISRLKSKMPWGIPVPDDPEQVIYVWFDALINYISTLGWPEDKKTFNNYWPGVQVAGKDNLRQQTAIWQAMLLSAGLPCSQQVFIHGFITVDNQKISKSLGNVIDPITLSQKYGTDALRYYLLAKINPYEDSDFTIKKFEEIYNADLANGLGNLVSRVAKLCEDSEYNHSTKEQLSFTKLLEIQKIEQIPEFGYKTEIEKFRFDNVLRKIFINIDNLNLRLNDKEPWKLIKENKITEAHNTLGEIVSEIIDLSKFLKPFLPDTAEKIEAQFSGPLIKSGKPLFPRLV